MAAILGGEEIFLKIAKSSLLRYPVGKKFLQIALSRTVKEIEANLCFSIFGKNSKIQNGHHLRKVFLKIGNSTFLRYPVGRKFQRNCSISHG